MSQDNRPLSGEDTLAIAEQVVSLMEQKAMCTISKEDQVNIGHMLGMFRDVGDRYTNQGGSSQGIEVFRGLGLRFVRTSKVAEHVVKGITYSLVFSAGVGVLILLWTGCKVGIGEILQSFQSGRR